MILLYPQFLGVDKPANTEFDESISPTQETILRYPEILGVDSLDEIPGTSLETI
ncbi:hypothetical protein Leryth_025334, partial [Lithospermum erythrorhizon]